MDNQTQITNAQVEEVARQIQKEVYGYSFPNDLTSVKTAKWHLTKTATLRNQLDAKNTMLLEEASVISDLREERDRLREALEFYADPENYHAMSFLSDRPCGAFAEDFDDAGHPDYNRPMPGKLARETLDSITPPTT